MNVDLNSYSINNRDFYSGVSKTKTELKKQYTKFIKGPISWDWMIKAARCPGKTCEVGLALWFLVGVTKKKTVKLTNALTGELGVPPRTKLRAVDALEEAGLISVIRHPGRSPLVTIKED